MAGYRAVATANGIVGIAFGAGIFALPAAIASVFGVELTEREGVVARMLGAAYIAMGLLAWSARGLGDASARLGVAQAQVTGWALTFVIVVPGLVAGYGNAVAWGIPVMQAAFTVGWGLVGLQLMRGRSRVLA